MAVVLSGLIAWAVIGSETTTGVSTVVPAGEKALPIGVVIAPADRPSAPALQGATLQGSHLNLVQHRGNVVAVNFWGSWCAPCRAQALALQRISQDSSAEGVTVVGVDERDTRTNASAFQKAHGVSYQSIFDADGQIAAQWPAAAGPPYTYVVDRQGRVAAIFVDSSTTLLQAALNQVAVERPPLHVEVATKRVWFPHGQASLDPPGPGQAPADPTAAWQRIAAALPNTICEGARSMVVQFGLFTNYLVVSTDPLRYKPYDYRNVPEWVVRCTDVPQPPALGPPLSESVRSGQNLPYSLPLVDSISVFDARTGKLLIGFDDTAS